MPSHGSREQAQGRLILLGILAAALLVRLPGATWELPGPLHTYSYHPDELPVLAAASSIRPSEGAFNPGFYNYGTLQIYLLALPVAASRTADGLNLGYATLLGRLLTILMGTATVGACWYGGRKIAGPAGAVTAASFVAVAPLHVQQSQFATVDVPAGLWTALALAMAISARRCAGGFFAGLAAATKYTTGIAICAPLAAALIGVSPGRRMLAAVAVAAAALAGFLIGCPGSVLWTGDFVRGFAFELRHAQSGHGLVFKDTGPGWLYHLLHSLLPGLGWPMLALSVAAIVYALRRSSRELGVILVFAAVYFALISAGAVRFARYVIPLVPALALLSAGLMREGRPRWALPAVSAGLALTAVYCVMLNSAFLRPDPRTEAAAWLRAQFGGRDAAVAVPTVPWFYSPPLSPEFGALSGEARRVAAAGTRGPRLLLSPADWNSSVLEQKPEAVVVSCFESEDRERLGDADYGRFMDVLGRDYRLARRFGGQPGLRPFTLVRRLPHDMRYPSPEISIYVRTAQH